MTLLEITIVMAIIAILVGLFVVAFQTSGESAMNAAAKALLKKARTGLASRLDWYELAPDNVDGLDTTLSSFQRRKFKFCFPERFYNTNPTDPEDNSNLDDINPDWLITKSMSEATYDNNHGDTETKRLKTESAECLYWILVGEGAKGDSPLKEDNFNSDEAKDTDGDGRREFVDPWGTPVRFIQSPHRATYRDAGMPNVPIIVSAGPDGEFGFDTAFTDGRPAGGAEGKKSYDNLTSDD